MHNGRTLKTLIESFIRESLGKDALIFYENQSPKGIQGKTWIRVKISVFTNNANTLNLTSKTGQGSINIHVFSPLNKGVKQAEDIADTLANAFNNCSKLQDDDGNVEIILRDGFTHSDDAIEDGYYRKSYASIFRFFRRG